MNVNTLDFSALPSSLSVPERGEGAGGEVIFTGAYI